MYSYCLFVETGKERILASGLEDILPDSTVLVPSYTYHLYTGSGQWTDQKRSLFPGYLFLYLNAPLEVNKVWEARPLGIHRFLKGPNGYELEGSDKAFAELVWACQGELGATPVVSNGTLFAFKDPLLGKAEARIVKVDKRQGNMQVEFRLDGKTSRAWMKYTLLPEKEEKSTEQIIEEVESVDDPVWELTTF